VTLTCPLDIPPGIFSGGPRSEKHVVLGFNATSSLASVRFGECVLRLGLHQRDSRRTISRNYLPEHTTFDLSFGKSFAEKYSVSVNMLNVANRRVELDNSLTFGGFHLERSACNLLAEFRYRFHY